MLLKFSSKGHSQQSTVLLNVRSCVSIRLGRPKHSASEGTCWHKSELYWGAASFCECSAHQDFAPFYILCHVFVVTRFLFCFLTLSGWAVPYLVLGKVPGLGKAVLSLRDDVCMYFQLWLSHIACLWALSFYLHSHTAASHCVLQLVTKKNDEIGPVFSSLHPGIMD